MSFGFRNFQVDGGFMKKLFEQIFIIAAASEVFLVECIFAKTSRSTMTCQCDAIHVF